MNSVLTMLKLELKSRFGFHKKLTKKAIGSLVINIIFTLIIYAVYITGLILITEIVVSGSVPLRYEYLTIACGLSIVTQTVVCTGALVKNLYYDGDNELLLRFPVDGAQIFMAKSAFVLIYNAALAYALTLPMLIVYGIETGMGVSYYLTAVPFTAFMSLLPFCLANLIALPVINLTNFIKNRFALILALVIIAIVAGFSVYMLILSGVLEYARNKSNVLLTPALLTEIRNIAEKLYPFNLYANVLYGKNSLLSFMFLVVINVGFMAAAYYISKKTVFPIVMRSIEREAEAFEVKTQDKQRPLFSSLLRKEYLLIFRSFNYSFQYLAMAITAPFMVFFCNNLACSIGDKSVGGRIIPGLTLLVVIIFITIIVSFASTAISREGNTFYLTKIMPVPYSYQILVKLILYFIVATASVLTSCIVVLAVFGGEKYGHNVGVKDALAIFAIAEFIIAGLSAAAIKSDMRSPSFEVSKSGELVEANKNVSTNMLSGCLIAVFYGIIAMIFSYVPLKIGGVSIISGMNSVYVALLIVSAIYAGIRLYALFRHINRRYNAINVQ